MVARVEKKGRGKEKCSPLVVETFEAFESYINVYDTGVKYKAGGTEYLCHRLTKETRGLMARYRAGERGLQYADGHPFETRHFFGPVYKIGQVHEHVTDNTTYYYTSSPSEYGMPYLDVDAHHDFQTDADAALALLLDLFGGDTLFARDSNRGHNGYLKVRHSGRVGLFNDTLQALQRLLHLLFRQNHILCDIEVKGTITTREKSGSLAKLPFNTFDPWTGRQSWGRAMLTEFKAKPDIDLDGLVAFVRRLAGVIDHERAEEFDSHVRSLKAREKARREIECESIEEMWADQARLMAEDESKFNPTDATLIPPTPGPCPVEAVAATAHTRLPVPVTADCQPRVRVDNHDEADSFHRQFWALLPLHRKLRRVATLREALAYIREHKLYTGDWSENATRREARVRWILGHQAKTFDPARCGEGHVEVGKFAGWARANFPEATRQTTKNAKGRSVASRVTWEDVAVYLSIFDFCVGRSANGDRGVPHLRVMKLWESLYARGVVGRQAKDERVAVIREMLVRRDVIRITDREFGPGKAMTYDYGPNYPGREFWRKPIKHKNVEPVLRGEETGPRVSERSQRNPKAFGSFSTDQRFGVVKYNDNKLLNTVPTLVGGQNASSRSPPPATGPPPDPATPKRSSQTAERNPALAGTRRGSAHSICDLLVRRRRPRGLRTTRRGRSDPSVEGKGRSLLPSQPRVVGLRTGGG